MPTTKTIVAVLTHRDDVQLCWLEEARAVAQRYDIRLIDEWGKDPQEQNKIVCEYTWKRACDGLAILSATATGPTYLLKQVLSQRKVVVMLNRTEGDMDPDTEWSLLRLRQQYGDLLAASTVPDAIETGRIQARQFMALLPQGGRLLYVIGDPFSSDGADRLKGMEDTLRQGPPITIGKVIGWFREDRAEAACYEWLRIVLRDSELELDLIGSQSEAMLQGIRRAIDRAERDFQCPTLRQVPLTAVDGSAQYKSEIDQGTLTATVEASSRVAKAVELMAEFWRHGAIPDQPIITLPVSSYPNLVDLRPIRSGLRHLPSTYNMRSARTLSSQSTT